MCLIAFKKYSVQSIRYNFQNSELINADDDDALQIWKWTNTAFWVVIKPRGRIDFGKTKKALCYVFNNSTSEIISWHSFSDLFLLTDSVDLNAEEKAALIASTKSPISFLSKLGQSISRKRTPKVTIPQTRWHLCFLGCCPSRWYWKWMSVCHFSTENQMFISSWQYMTFRIAELHW